MFWNRVLKFASSTVPVVNWRVNSKLFYCMWLASKFGLNVVWHDSEELVEFYFPLIVFLRTCWIKFAMFFISALHRDSEGKAQIQLTVQVRHWLVCVLLCLSWLCLILLVFVSVALCVISQSCISARFLFPTIWLCLQTTNNTNSCERINCKEHNVWFWSRMFIQTCSRKGIDSHSDEHPHQS